MTERSGFIDVAIDPSPLALVRVLDDDTTHVRRDAGPDQSFGAITSDGVVVAAAAFDSIGRMAPAISCSDSPVSIGWFDDVDEPTELVSEIRRLLDDARPVECMLQLAAMAYPDFPSHDVRSSQRDSASPSAPRSALQGLPDGCAQSTS